MRLVTVVNMTFWYIFVWNIDIFLQNYYDTTQIHSNSVWSNMIIAVSLGNWWKKIDKKRQNTFFAMSYLCMCQIILKFWRCKKNQEYLLPWIATLFNIMVYSCVKLFEKKWVGIKYSQKMFDLEIWPWPQTIIGEPPLCT